MELNKLKVWDKERKMMRFIGDSLKTSVMVIRADEWEMGESFYEWDVEKAVTNETGILLKPTGQFDKNGAEIYEGDLVKMFADSLNNEKIVEVKWRKEGFWEYFNGFDNCEVIGNKFEHSTLLNPPQYDT